MRRLAESVLFDGVDRLPEPVAALLATAPFQSGAGWWRTVEAAAMPAASTAVYAVLPGPAVVALRRDRGGLAALTTPYTCLWEPIAAPECDLRASGLAFGRLARQGVLRLDALDADRPGLAEFVAGVRRAGRLIRRFDHFGNWHEPVVPGDWAGYLAQRPGALRETVRRRTAKAARDPRIAVSLVASDGMETGIAAYAAIYARSWKEPEPFPDFAATIMRVAGAAGVLRLGVLTLDGVPVAAQFWTVEAGIATVHKLAHDEAAKAISPGTVLTAWMIRHLIEVERVTGLDFGRGDDPYKALWTSQRRQRIGLLLIDPRRPRGIGAIARSMVAGGLRHRRPASDSGGGDSAA